MTYKTAIDLFLTKYRIEILKRKEKYPALNNNEIMVLLSEVQAELGNRYRLWIKNAVIELTSGIYRYGVGTESGQMPADLLAFKEVHRLASVSSDGSGSGSSSGGSSTGGFGTNFGSNFGGGGLTVIGGSVNGNGTEYDGSNIRQLDMISREDMNQIVKYQGLPAKYTVYGTDSSKVLEIDAIPGEGYSLEYLYYARLEIFDNTASTKDSVSFNDYNTTLAGFGGSWKLPLQWQNLIVEGAIAGIFPEKMNLYLSKIDNLHNRRPEYVSGRLKYSLGVQ